MHPMKRALGLVASVVAQVVSVHVGAACAPASEADVPPPAPTSHAAHCTLPKPDARDVEGPQPALRILVDDGEASTPDDDVIDVAVPSPVQAWLEAQGAAAAHAAWHGVRRWDQACAKDDACVDNAPLLERGLSRAPIQEGAPGDGVAFLAMHRHMLQSARAAFPRHASLFAGFTHVPRVADDVENPLPGWPVTWSERQARALDILEHIEDHADLFPTDDALGLFISVPFRWTAEDPKVAADDASSGIHFGLHRQWAVDRSPVKMTQLGPSVGNAIFWQVHGFLDRAWGRYRAARELMEKAPRDDATADGLRPSDDELSDLIDAQCAEMHRLGGA
jgi:hypothetical protein